jgi:hypothetical protein
MMVGYWGVWVLWWLVIEIGMVRRYTKTYGHIDGKKRSLGGVHDGGVTMMGGGLEWKVVVEVAGWSREFYATTGEGASGNRNRGRKGR